MIGNLLMLMIRCHYQLQHHLEVKKGLKHNTILCDKTSVKLFRETSSSVAKILLRFLLHGSVVLLLLKCELESIVSNVSYVLNDC